MVTTLSVYCDGGSRGNPGEASYGFVVKKNDVVVFSHGKRIGIATNNVAEYSAVKAALEHILSQNYEYSQINFYLDSLLAVNQINGLWKIKNESLRGYYMEIKKLLSQLTATVTFTAVPREQNKLADQQVNLALDNLI